MRIASRPPDVPDGFTVMTQCSFCDEFCRDFLLLFNDKHGEAATICTSCITKIVDAADKRWGVDSQA